jgi:hypothetical protein
MLLVHPYTSSKSGNLSIPQFLTRLTFSLSSFSFKPGVDYFCLTNITNVQPHQRLIGRDITFPLDSNYEPLFPRRSFTSVRRTLIPGQFLNEINYLALCETSFSQEGINIVQRIVNVIFSFEYFFIEYGSHE